MKTEMQVATVQKCDVTDCAYNINNSCCTPAITIGDEVMPRCDTFCRSQSRGGDAGCTASVGACKVSQCMYNESLECQASAISVGYQSDEPMCLTFSAR
ncbi:MAG TPA: DUF1540 domain-containing protein [Anaerohalosphaeraceae bacterium]|nr:DUF1540 domain-containing protein [Anaerohalosphaeraceae bacterium]HRT51654.1 DUF1540 domain-containing protein [Anaerohalosphaeraceae bacterium]HRT87681.1 DUF1540 domain-containing protein [Anaerohalosphaeraceae bacterium]